MNKKRGEDVVKAYELVMERLYGSEDTARYLSAIFCILKDNVYADIYFSKENENEIIRKKNLEWMRQIVGDIIQKNIFKLSALYKRFKGLSLVLIIDLIIIGYVDMVICQDPLKEDVNLFLDTRCVTYGLDEALLYLL